jgi:NAD-dependent dihydropyrimidine dehydrogenase PreA subunit
MPVECDLNTLVYDEALCNGCGMCSIVCPHGVFEVEGGKARIVSHESCMECGACQVNCPSGAITVSSGVGCASAMIWAALRGKREATCGCSTDCGTDGATDQATDRGTDCGCGSAGKGSDDPAGQGPSCCCS